MTQRRIYQNKNPYFITTNTFNKIWFFDKDIYAKILYQTIFEINKKYNPIVYGFCIMPNHLRLLMKFIGESDVSDYMHDIKSKTVYNLKPYLGRYIRLWESRFYDRIVKSSDDHKKTLIYIKNNPVKWDLPSKYLCRPYMV